MPDVSIQCDCGRASDAPPRWAGRRVLCPFCGREHVVPAPPPPAPRERRRRRRFGRRRSEERPGGEPERRGPPAGLRRAVRPPHPDDVAAARRKRRRRIVIVTILVVVLGGGYIGARIAWKRYKRSLYRGSPAATRPVRPASELHEVRHRLRHLRRLERQLRREPTSAERAEEYVDAARALDRDLARLALYPSARAHLDNALAWFYLTTPLEKFRDPEAGLEYVDKALFGHHRENPAILDTWAEALFQTGRYDEARDAARAAVLRDPDEPAYRETLDRIEDALLRRARRRALR